MIEEPNIGCKGDYRSSERQIAKTSPRDRRYLRGRKSRKFALERTRDKEGCASTKKLHPCRGCCRYGRVLPLRNDRTQRPKESRAEKEQHYFRGDRARLLRPRGQHEQRNAGEARNQ